MRRHRTDRNQAAIVRALRDLNMSVAVTSGVGNGFADITVGFRGKNYLFEIKNDKQVVSKQKLTSAEEKFHAAWRGKIHTVKTLDEILTIVQQQDKR